MLLWRDVLNARKWNKKSLTERFLIFILNITYKYLTSFDKHPRRLFNLEALRGGVIRG